MATFDWLHPALDLKRIEEIKHGLNRRLFSTKQSRRAARGGWGVTTSAFIVGKPSNKLFPPNAKTRVSLLLLK